MSSPTRRGTGPPAPIGSSGPAASLAPSSATSPPTRSPLRASRTSTSQRRTASKPKPVPPHSRPWTVTRTRPAQAHDGSGIPHDRASSVLLRRGLQRRDLRYPLPLGNHAGHGCALGPGLDISSAPRHRSPQGWRRMSVACTWKLLADRCDGDRAQRADDGDGLSVVETCGDYCCGDHCGDAVFAAKRKG
jgi:hypothetical protein